MRRSLPGLVFIGVIVAIAVWLGKVLTIPQIEIKIPLSSEINVTSKVGEDKIKVVRVVDGDTIEIEGGKVVRYIGINTPETKDPRRGVECFGKEAEEYNKQLVEGKEVRLEKDVSDKDKYGRLLRYVWLDDQMINEKLVASGFAQVATYPPDVRYKNKLVKAQTDARLNLLGLWKKCK